MKLKELIDVIDSGLNYEVYASHRYSSILYDSDARMSDESSKRRRKDLLNSLLDKTVSQVNASGDNQTLEIYIKED